MIQSLFSANADEIVNLTPKFSPAVLDPEALDGLQGVKILAGQVQFDESADIAPIATEFTVLAQTNLVGIDLNIVLPSDNGVVDIASGSDLVIDRPITAQQRVSLASTGYVDEGGDVIGGDLHLTVSVVDTSLLELLGNIQIDAPGSSPDEKSMAVLNTNDVTFRPGAILNFDVQGFDDGEYDQVNAAGAVTLGSDGEAGVALNVNLGFFTIEVDEELVIINNDGTDAVEGTFENLPEGGEINALGQLFSVSYQGGTGNDVVLTALESRVAANSASITINEGDTAFNAGTFTEPSDLSTILSASIGSVTRSGQGTWRWTFNSSDGPDENQVVTITATDVNGLSTKGTFELTVNNVAPALAVNTDSVTVNESDTAANTGTFSDPGADTVELTTSVGQVIDNGNGAWSWSYDSTDGPDNSQVVTISATDSDSAKTSVTFDLTVNNVAPSLAANNAAVTINEGGTAVNSGTFTDPGEDILALTASIGTVVDNGNGTWRWSFDSTDGPDDSQTVTITATDSDQAVTTTTFALTVNNVTPSLAANNAAVTINEGDTAVNSGTLADPGDDILTLTASIGTVVDGGNGNWSWSFDSTDGPDESRTVTVTATDSDNAATTTIFALTVNNVAPNLAVNGASVTINESETAVNSGTFSDPGADTVALTASLGTVVDRGNGTWSWSFDSTDGPDDSQTVTITATDSDQADTSVTFDLTVNNMAPSPAANNASVTINESVTAVNSGTFSDPGDDTITLSASIGTVLDNGNRTWNWSFDSDDGPSESQTVTITADDGDPTNNIGTAQFQLVVNNVLPTATFSNGRIGRPGLACHGHLLQPGRSLFGRCRGWVPLCL